MRDRPQPQRFTVGPFLFTDKVGSPWPEGVNIFHSVFCRLHLARCSSVWVPSPMREGRNTLVFMEVQPRGLVLHRLCSRPATPMGLREQGLPGLEVQTVFLRPLLVLPPFHEVQGRGSLT